MPSPAYWPAVRSVALAELTVGDVLRAAAADAPDRVAVVVGEKEPAARRRLTFAELLDEAERGARALLTRFAPGEHVAVWAHSILEWESMQMAASLAGLVLVTVNPALRPREAHYILHQSRSAGVFVVRQFRGVALPRVVDGIRPELPHLREVHLLDDWNEFAGAGASDAPLPAVAPGDPVMIQYTSGTTGPPKGVLLAHRGVVNNSLLFSRRFNLDQSPVWINPMPMFHVGGCVFGALGALWMRTTHVLVPAFDPGLLLDLIESERGSFLPTVPTMLVALLEHPDLDQRDVSSLRTVMSGGTTVPAALVHQVRSRFGARFGTVFGQTEASGVITASHPDDSLSDTAGTVGRPIDATEVKVVDPDTGRTVARDEVGEVCVRGVGVMLGYHDMAEATAAAIDADGWLHTGDLGAMDERGYCRITGRLKDIVIRGGENISPREIEDVLFAHPGVAEVAVVGVPDDRWGEQLAAFIRPAEGRRPDEDELRAFVGDHLARHKVPRYWIFVDQFPVTASGKIQKFKLRQQFEGEARTHSR